MAIKITGVGAEVTRKLHSATRQYFRVPPTQVETAKKRKRERKKKISYRRFLSQGATAAGSASWFRFESSIVRLVFSLLLLLALEQRCVPVIIGDPRKKEKGGKKNKIADSHADAWNYAARFGITRTSATASGRSNCAVCLTQAARAARMFLLLRSSTRYTRGEQCSGGIIKGC